MCTAFFDVNGIEEDKKKVPVFLNATGSRTYALLQDLLALVKPAEKNFADLQKVLTEHFEPKPIVIAERFYFHQRTQGANESVLEYVAELRRLATHCEFGAFLQEALRDHLVCGLRNSKVMMLQAPVVLFTKQGSTVQLTLTGSLRAQKFVTAVVIQTTLLLIADFVMLNAKSTIRKDT